MIDEEIFNVCSFFVSQENTNFALVKTIAGIRITR